jgi:cell division protein FtsA
MSRRNEYIAAVDIGTTKIVALVGKITSNGRLEILGIGQSPSNGVKRGVVLNIDETANAIQKAVKDAEEESGIKFDEVYVGIAGQHIKSTKNRGIKYIDSELGEITQEAVDELYNDMKKLPIEAGEEIIHVIPQNYIVDNETGVKNPVGMSGRRLEGNFHIVIGQIASAKNIEKCINRVGLKVKKLILEPLASSEAVLTDDEKEAGIALVDIGGGTTDLAVYYNGIIRHTAVIPFGGNVITSDIKEGCSILHRYAESLKVQYGSAIADMAPENKVVTIPGIGGRDSKEISFKSLAEIIQARMEEIIDAIAFELENSGFTEKLAAGIALTGGGAMLRNLPQLMKYSTGLDVRVGLPNRFFSAGSKEKTNQPQYSTAVGLVLKGVKYEQVQYRNSAKAVQKVQPVVVESELVEETQNIQEGTKKVKFLDKIKNTFIDIFDETDTKM